MNFFCKESHFDKWLEGKNIDSDLYFKLSLSDALEASEMVFKLD
ncbi:MAG: hypothetical protein RSA01_09795 [Clostridium sp.]